MVCSVILRVLLNHSYVLLSHSTLGGWEAQGGGGSRGRKGALTGGGAEEAVEARGVGGSGAHQRGGVGRRRQGAHGGGGRATRGRSVGGHAGVGRLVGVDLLGPGDEP
jgi:hypothetical protein